jgi:hypothetical protein
MLALPYFCKILLNMNIFLERPGFAAIPTAHLAGQGPF